MNCVCVFQNVPQVDAEGFCIRPEASENDILFTCGFTLLKLPSSVLSLRCHAQKPLSSFSHVHTHHTWAACPLWANHIVEVDSPSNTSRYCCCCCCCSLLNSWVHMPKRILSIRRLTLKTRTSPGNSTWRSSRFSPTTSHSRPEPPSTSSRPPSETSSCRPPPWYSDITWHAHTHTHTNPQVQFGHRPVALQVWLFHSVVAAQSTLPQQH